MIKPYLKIQTRIEMTKKIDPELFQSNNHLILVCVSLRCDIFLYSIETFLVWVSCFLVKKLYSIFIRLHHWKWNFFVRSCRLDMLNSYMRQANTQNIKSKKWILGWAQSIWKSELRTQKFWKFSLKKVFSARWHCYKLVFQK